VQASGTSQAASSSPEVPFNQVLQREMTGRRDNEQQVKAPSPKEKDNKPAPAQSVAGQASAQTKKAESANTTDKRETESTEEADEKVENAAVASAELLALVTNMAQMATSSQANASETATDSATTADPALTTGIEKEITGKLTADPLSGKADGAETAEQKPEARAGQSFADIAKNIGQNNSSADKQATSSFESAKSSAGIQNSILAEGQESVLQEQTATAVATSPMTSLQQALNKAQPSFAADKLTPPVGTPAWDQAVGQKVVWMVAGGQQSASLTLNPPDLGPLQVVLNVNNSQANATFVAAQPEVRQALEAALPKLREMLGDAGIQLGQANVSAGHSQQGNGFAERQQRQSFGAVGQDDKQATQPVQAVRQQIVKSGNGMVDTFA
jgi:flagellar hook-length control protein FliK